jgi:hypothetical protein
LLLPALKNAPIKMYKQKVRKNKQKQKYSKFAYFLGYNFFKGIFLQHVGVNFAQLLPRFHSILIKINI